MTRSPLGKGKPGNFSAAEGKRNLEQGVLKAGKLERA
jgi:hypothetical protein